MNLYFHLTPALFRTLHENGSKEKKYFCQQNKQNERKTTTKDVFLLAVALISNSGLRVFEHVPQIKLGENCIIDDDVVVVVFIVFRIIISSNTDTHSNAGKLKHSFIENDKSYRKRELAIRMAIWG